MSLKQNIADYINKEIEYGKPSSADYFIRTDLAREIKNNPALLANDELEKYINDYWKKTVSENPDAVFCGGYDFYRYLSEQQITNDNFKEIIENYDDPELYKTDLNDISLNNCDTIYEILQANEKDIHYMLIRYDHIKVLKGYNTELLDTVDSSIENRIKELRYEQKYLGTKINKFVNIPKTEFAKIGLWQIEQELLFRHENNISDTTNIVDENKNISNNTSDSDETEEELYYLHRNMRDPECILDATMQIVGLKYIVKAGSIVSPSLTSRIDRQTKKKRNAANIIDNVLQNDIVCGTPSAAANFVTGMYTNGWTSWKDKNGNTLDQLKRDIDEGELEENNNISSGASSESINSEDAERAESSYNSFNSNTSEVAEKSIEADRLSEEGVQQVTDEFIRKILSERKDVIENIENRIEKHRQEQELQEKWYYRASEHPTEFTTKDIYADSVLNDAREILKERHNLFIYGNTGDGKTELAYLLAHELTGQNIGKNSDTECKRICWTSARNADSLVGAGLKQYGLLDRFIKYISNNNISEPCVLICNEVQASDMGYILGEKLWESFNDTRPALIPDNLYLIFTGCMDRDFGIDTQVLERIKPVEIDYLSKKNKDVHNKILEAYGSDYEDTLNTIEEINDSENRQIISMRQFVRLANNESITIVHRELLSETNQDKIKKLERNNDKY